MNKKLLIIILFLYLNTGNVFAQISQRPLGALYTGSGAYSLNHVDVFSFTVNQAALAQIKNPAIGIYGERRFLLSELNFYNAVLAIPTTSGNFGLKTIYYGSGSYNETQLGLAYGRKLGNKIDIGAQFNYNGVSISSYGNAAIIGFEMGTILHLTNHVHAGFHVSNPLGSKFGKDQEEKLPSVYTIGLGYDASDKFLFSAEIVKEENQNVNVNAGFQYRLIPQLQTRAGISTTNGTAWIGVGFNLKKFRIDLSSSYHPKLGLTPGLLLLLNLNQKEK